MRTLTVEVSGIACVKIQGQFEIEVEEHDSEEETEREAERIAQAMVEDEQFVESIDWEMNESREDWSQADASREKRTETLADLRIDNIMDYR